MNKVAHIFIILCMFMFVSSCKKTIMEERQPCNATVTFVLSGGESLKESTLVYFDASVDGEIMSSLSIPLRTARREIRLELPRGETLSATATVFKAPSAGNELEEKEIDYYGELSIPFPGIADEVSPIQLTISKK